MLLKVQSVNIVGLNMTDYQRELDPYGEKIKTKPEPKPVSDDIKAIQLICKKDYKEAIKVLVELF